MTLRGVKAVESIQKSKVEFEDTHLSELLQYWGSS